MRPSGLRRTVRDGSNTVCLALLGISLLFQYTYARNITIDDTNPEIHYSGPWNVGQTCGSCQMMPDPSLVYNHSWHNATRNFETPVSLSYNFTGTALYIYGIIANVTSLNTTSNVSLVLNIDNKTYSQEFLAQNGDMYRYNVPVFSIHHLEETNHTVSISLQENSQFFFDYLVYTNPDAAASSSLSNTSLISVIIVGSLILVFVLAALVSLFLHTRRVRFDPSNLPSAKDMLPTPFTLQQPSNTQLSGAASWRNCSTPRSHSPTGPYEARDNETSKPSSGLQGQKEHHVGGSVDDRSSVSSKLEAGDSDITSERYHIVRARGGDLVSTVISRWSDEDLLGSGTTSLSIRTERVPQTGGIPPRGVGGKSASRNSARLGYGAQGWNVAPPPPYYVEQTQ